MPDSRFYSSRGPLSLAVLAEVGGAQLVRSDDGERLIATVSQGPAATADALTYCASKSAVRRLAVDAGACVTTSALAAEVPRSVACLTATNPRLAFARIAAALFPAPPLQPGVSERAVVDPDATLAQDCRIEAGAVIGANAEVGAGAWVGPNSTIGPGVVLGPRTRVDANVTIVYAVIGADVRIHAGARIGQDGFGFVLASKDEGHVRVPQLGRVRIEDRADIGANTCIDRGALGDTVIGEGAFLDNLVHVGHNVQIGPHVVLAGQCGIGGSSSIGAFSTAGGQVGIADHITVGHRCQIGGKAGVTRDLDDDAKVAGMPAVPVARYLRQAVALERLATRRGQPGGGAAS